MDIDDVTRFHSIPWVSKLLQDTSFVTVPPSNRNKKSSTEDSLFAVTLKSKTTLSACLCQYRRPPSSSNSRPAESLSAIGTNEIRIFYILGTEMNGYPGVLHGGIVATLLDESLGFLLVLESGYQAPSQSAPGPKMVTAYLNTNFLRPVQTPGVIVVHAKLEEAKEDRKWKIKGWICDANNQVLATAECLYVKTRSKM